MATQAALIAGTIMGMKRALRREHDDPPPDDPIAQPTNRGNKLRANAKYVREGAMGYVHGEDLYKEKIEHAGYTRYILQRNPIRYDSEGEELEEDDEDSEADAAAAEENPFSGIALETLLCPLKHPSELPTHPSLSHPYTSQALEQMAMGVEAKLREERALLWRARNLHQQFLGDGGWMPCGAIETPEDRWIFEPRIVDEQQSALGSGYGLGGPETPLTTGENNMPQDGATLVMASVQESQQEPADADVEMAEVPALSEDAHANNGNPEQMKEPKAEEADAMVKDLPQHTEAASGSAHEKDSASGPAGQDTTAKSDGNPNEMEMSKGSNNADAEAACGHAQEHETEQDAEMHDGSSPEPPRRMTTRAQTNAANPQAEDGQSPFSSADSTGSLPTPHPLYLIPDNVRPDANFGLPATEAEETRRLLWSYIQKQEETVRGFEHMLESLLRACRMKSDVLEWSKAEGHIGEMSDGEDWYDREKWGLGEGEDLKKGTDEDDVETVEDSRTTAKRNRQRRA